MVGLEGIYVLYFYWENGKLIGFEVDLVCDLVKKMGYKVKFVLIKWDFLIVGVGFKKFDVVINDIVMMLEC